MWLVLVVCILFLLNGTALKHTLQEERDVCLTQTLHLTESEHPEQRPNKSLLNEGIRKQDANPSSFLFPPLIINFLKL